MPGLGGRHDAGGNCKQELKGFSCVLSTHAEWTAVFVKASGNSLAQTTCFTGPTGTGFDPASQMLLTQSDMAGFAARHRLKHSPGTYWEYTSANTLILDRLLGSTVGGGAASMREFAERELFTPLHMSHVTMEFDGRGVFVGSSYVYAPARAFARFGVLYLHDGVAPDGHRILPEGWVAWSRGSILGAQYGAGFWTNDGPSRYAAWRVEHGFPKDGFFANGALGQNIYIVPSEHVVVARFRMLVA